MMRHVWTVYCHQSIIDQGTGALSLFNVADEIHVTPSSKSSSRDRAITSKFDSTLATLWARREWDTPVKGRMRVMLVAPDDQKLITSAPKEIDLSDNLMLRMCAKIDSLTVNTSGLYEWVVEQLEERTERWTEEARVPFVVKFTDDS